MKKEKTEEFRLALEAAVASFELDALTAEQIDRCVAHYKLLCRWNARVNLTRITEPREAARRHYAESLFGSRFIEDERTILDIGSGAGFPAIPLAIVRPDIEVTALEANRKKALFLKEAKDEFRLGNLRIASARLEEFDWSCYQLLASRALDRAEVILPAIIERLSPEQRMMLYCTRDLVATLVERVQCKLEPYPIPHTDSRLIAILARE